MSLPPDGSGTRATISEAAEFSPAEHLRLPNGMEIVPQSRTEAEHFYDDLFVKRIYLRHGIVLAPGDCVFDVGGNIGMFALYADRHAPGAIIYTFEPAPPLYRRLRANLALNGAAVRAFNFGIADGERTARFTFYPNSSGMSSFHADTGEERDVLLAMMRRQRKDGVEGMDALMEYTEELLDERFRSVEMECRLRPLSAVIREQGVPRIDLLKIDVQKAEMEVLRGIDDEDWPRIRQIVMEVHDLEGRLDEVTRLLEGRGFRVVVEQDEAVEGSILFNLFAVRAAPSAAPPAVDAAEVAAGDDAPPRPASWQLLLLSAPSPDALHDSAARLARHLAAHPSIPLADVAFTLRAERGGHSHRRAVVVGEGENAPALLVSRDPLRTAEGVVDGSPRPVVFLFPGVGEQYPGMARGLYDAEPVFRAAVDQCVDILRPLQGFDLREALFADWGVPSASPGGLDLRRMLGRAPLSASAARLNRTEVAQPAAFVIGYALARLWDAWGVHPHAVAGHSLGEYTAACVAGVFRLEDALELVAHRARTIQELPAGAMLAVPLSPDAAAPFLGDGVALAAVNAPELCVLSGTEAAIARAEQDLARAGHVARRLAATHAFHSPLMQPAAERVAALAARYPLSAPRIPMLSNATGGWLTEAQATDPGYWARHLVGSVRFDRCARELLAEPGRVLVEMGPGGSLGAFVHQQAAADGTGAPASVATLPHAADDVPDEAFALAALGRLWTAGVQPDEAAFERHAGRRISLPGEPDAAAPAVDAEDPAESGGEADAEGTEVTRVLAGLWREVLGAKAGLHDDFFQVGGHSLAATRLIARVRERFGVEMRLRTLFQTRTLFALAQWIEAAVAARPDPSGAAGATWET